MPPPNSAFTGFRSPISSAPRSKLQGGGTRLGTRLGTQWRTQRGLGTRPGPYLS